MPWKESSVMDEQIRFVIRLKDGESMTARKTSYKIVDRYEECGLEGLTDRARHPQRYAPSAQKCYLCLRYNLLPMCPVRTITNMVPVVGLEPTTYGL